MFEEFDLPRAPAVRCRLVWRCASCRQRPYLSANCLPPTPPLGTYCTQIWRTVGQWVHLGHGHSPRAAVFSLCARGAVGYSDCDTAGSGAAYENTDTHALKCQSVPVPPRTRPHAVGTPSTGRRDRFFSCAGRIELAAATYIRLCLPPSKRTAPTRSVRAYNHTVSSVHLLSCSRLLSLKSLGRK